MHDTVAVGLNQGILRTENEIIHPFYIWLYFWLGRSLESRSKQGDAAVRPIWHGRIVEPQSAIMYGLGRVRMSLIEGYLHRDGGHPDRRSRRRRILRQLRCSRGANAEIDRRATVGDIVDAQSMAAVAFITDDLDLVRLPRSKILAD